MDKKTVSESELQQAIADKDNQGIIKKVCSHYAHLLSPEALKACGDMAVWRCLQSHQTGRQKFTSSLYYFVGWECQREIRDSRHRELPCLSDIDNTPQEYMDPINTLIVQECLSVLTPQEQEIVIARFVNNRTLDDIGKEFGYSRQGIKNIINRSLTAMRKVVGLTS